MKKITLLVVILFITIGLNAQTINTTYSWPSTSWTISGAYDAGNLLGNPTLSLGGTSYFKFDDHQVSHTGDQIYLEAPAIDLSGAYANAERVLKINTTIAFTLTAATSEMIGFEYWDATANKWEAMLQGSPDSGDTIGTYTTNSGELIDIYFDFKGFSLAQQQGFKYRVFYTDGGLSQGGGVYLVVNSVTSSNISCNAPTDVLPTEVNATDAMFVWTTNNTPAEKLWLIEYGLANFTRGTGVFDETGSIPYYLGGLGQGNSYDIYVRADCTPSGMNGGAVYSDWSNKLSFTTGATQTCSDVTFVLPQTITENSIQLIWQFANESSWNVEYGPAQYTRGGVDKLGSFNTISPGATISGLSPNTGYDIYIQAICGSDLGNWSGPFHYQTLAGTIGWANLQFPGSGTINLGDKFMVFAQVYISGITDSQGQGSGVNAWIGYGTADSNPNTWTNWVTAIYNTDSGNNDEYMADIGLAIPVDGNYKYASRFQIGQGSYSYGGFSLGGGNFWDGSSYVSGDLTINRTFSEWSSQSSPLGSQVLGKVQFVSPTEGWITVENGQLLHTLDAGANWMAVDPTPLETDWIMFEPAGAMFWLNQTHGWYISTLGTGFANSMGAVLHYTTDGGINWIEKVISNAANEIGVQVQFFDANNGWLITFNAGTLIGSVYSTSDGGANWTLVNSGTDSGLLYFLDANNGYRIITTSGNEPFTIEHTTDGGTNWSPQYTDNTSGNYNAMFFIDANNGWIIGNNDKILKTSDGGTNWIPITNTGLPVGGNNFKALFFNNVNVGRIGAGGDDNRNSSILYTADGGTTWEIQPLALTPSVKSNNNSAAKTEIVDGTADIFSIYFVDELNGWYVADNGQIVNTTGDPLSVHQNNLNTIEGFNYYPNPVQDYLTLNANQKIDQVEVYNLLGQQLLQVKPNLSKYQLKLNVIKSGFYFIKVQIAGKTGTFKILKQ